MVWVPSGSDQIRITPAGIQFRAAAEAGREEEFLWIGLSLLLRFPLRGPRRAKGPLHASSDLLPYWFLFAGMRELHGYIWWTELTRVIAQVFRFDEAPAAIDSVRALRDGRAAVDDFPRVAATEEGAPYNSLNQVFVHAGLNSALITIDRIDSAYTRHERKHWLRDDYVYLVDRALGSAIKGTECDETADLVRRMPRAPTFGDEDAYFTYLGAEVPAMPSATETATTIVMGGQVVRVLRVGRDCQRDGPTEISGSVTVLCALAREQRVILSDDLERSYLVEDKQRRAGGVTVRLRRARQISDSEVVRAVLEGQG